MTPQQFARKYESKIHVLIWLFPILGGFVALARKDFNPSTNGALCTIMDNLVDCTGEPETFGTCIRGQNGPKDSLFIVVIPSLLTFLVLLFNLLRFTAHFYTAEKLMRAENVDKNNYSSRRFKTSSIFCCKCNKEESDRQDTNHTQSLTMRSFVQCSMYIAAYFLTYSAIILVFIMAAAGMPRPSWVKWCSAIFWPLGGFFNILVYSRPKVSATRDKYPEYAHFSWIFIFLLVFVSGGEVPTTIDQEEQKSRSSFHVEDVGLTSSQFEIERQRAIAGSSGADSFMKEFYAEFGEC